MSTPDTPQGRPGDPEDLIGSSIDGRYRLLRLVSSGANTSVYEATDDAHGRAVTLKLLRPSIAQSPSFRERFDDEMRAASTLSHPNIAALYDWGITPIGDTSTAFVVTESLTAGSLRDVFDRGRQLSPSQALMVGLEACRGLDHAHRRGFVHTELNPSKLVFGDDRRLRIADFGLARLLGAPAWEHPDSVPNHVAWYAAPEQGTGVDIDGRADVYALALSLHEAVTGEVPFATDSTVATLSARIGRLMPVSADLGPLAAVLERAGRPEAAERATAAEFGQALVQTAAKLPRPEPLPLPSTALFETPTDQLRRPDDPTGGVTRPEPGDDSDAAPLVVPVDADDPVHDDPVHDDTDSDDRAPASVPIVVPDAEPVVPTGPDELVILPLDSDLGPRGDGAAESIGAPVAETAEGGLPPTQPMAQIATPAHAAPVRQRRRPGRWFGRAVLAVVIVGALAVLAVLAGRLFSTPEYTVPNLVTVPEAEARNLVAANGWDIVIERERSDLVPVVGLIIRTAPAAGVLLAEGEPFLMVVSEGPTLRELPDSDGAALADAENRLRERGLISEVVQVFDETVPFGTVIAWSVPGDPTLGAGSLVPPETIVELVVSQGPAPRTVPTLGDVALSDARIAVESEGLVLVEEAEAFSDDIAAGRVISQTPEPGTQVERGDTVTIVVSKGPDVVEFPDLSAVANYVEAAAVLSDAGFEPSLTFGDAEGELLDVTIDGEPAQPGTLYRRGTRVEIEALTLD